MLKFATLASSLKRRRAVRDEDFLPVIKDIGAELGLITDYGDPHAFETVASPNDDVLTGVNCLRGLAIEFFFFAEVELTNAWDNPASKRGRIEQAEKALFLTFRYMALPIWHETRRIGKLAGLRGSPQETEISLAATHYQRLCCKAPLRTSP